MPDAKQKQNRESRSDTVGEDLGNRIDRATQHALALGLEIKSWVDLKFKTFQAELFEEVEAKAKPVAIDGAIFLILGLGSLFGMVALALFLGTLLGHMGWGFLVVMGIFWIVAGGMWVYNKSLKKKNRSGATKALSDKKTTRSIESADNPLLQESASPSNGRERP